MPPKSTSTSPLVTRKTPSAPSSSRQMESLALYGISPNVEVSVCSSAAASEANSYTLQGIDALPEARHAVCSKIHRCSSGGLVVLIDEAAE